MSQQSQQSQQAPPPLSLHRSLSHADKAMTDATPFIQQLKEGETIFLNYWIDTKKIITYAWLERKEGILRQFENECTLKDLPSNWTYEGVPHPCNAFLPLSIN
jgi:hypothetical protein